MADFTHTKSRIAEFRLRNSLTQSELATYLGVKQGYISQIEKRCAEPQALISRIIQNENGWDTTPLDPQTVIQYNNNGDNIGGDKLTFNSDNEEIIRLRAELKAKESEIKWLRNMVERLSLREA